MRVALYVTCLVDLMRPSVGFDALRLLESVGAEVIVPEGQTCCGQPAWSAGDRHLAVDLARKAIGELEGYDHVVIPSGSCADHLRNVYPKLFADDPDWGPRAHGLAARAYELTCFLVEVAKGAVLPAEFAGTVTYHDSCKGLRGLGIKRQPRERFAQGARPGADRNGRLRGMLWFRRRFFGQIRRSVDQDSSTASAMPSPPPGPMPWSAATSAAC